MASQNCYKVALNQLICGNGVSKLLQSSFKSSLVVTMAAQREGGERSCLGDSFDQKI